MHPDILRKFGIALLLVILMASTSFAGLRGRGKYSGVVIFDRWDTCYLYSGIYVMYVSNKVKEGLRKYEGKSVTINATDVFQPINPGDGLIRKFKFLSVAKTYPTGLDQLSLTVEPKFGNNESPALVLVIENRGASAIEVSPQALAPTLLGPKLHETFSPSDGKSDAWLTRAPLKFPPFLKEIGFGPKTDKTHPIMREGDIEYYLNVEQELADKILIPPGGKTTIAMSFKLPKGQYGFLFGYAGGVHETKAIASKPVAFSVDGNGRAWLDSAVAQFTDFPIGMNGAPVTKLKGAVHTVLTIKQRRERVFDTIVEVYDTNGRLTESMSSNAGVEVHSGTMVRLGEKKIYTYDAQGRVAKVMTFAVEGDYAHSEIYSYDSQNRLTGTIIHEGDGKEVGKRTYTYFPEKREVVATWDFYRDGSPSSQPNKNLLAYNERNQWTKRTDFDKSGKPGSVSTFDYDKDGNFIKTSICCEYTYAHSYKYEFDSHGNWIEQQEIYSQPGAEPDTESLRTYRVITYYSDRDTKPRKE